MIPLVIQSHLPPVRRQQQTGLEHGNSFDLDFHTIPFHGEDALLQKHYVSKRSRRQKGILAFLAQDGDKRFFCYGNADLRKEDQNDEILRFVEFWKQRAGNVPGELIFDSKLTTQRNLSELNRLGVQFITLRRRGPKIVDDIEARPRSAWRRINLSGVSRQYRTPRILDDHISLDDYEGTLRQIAIKDLGHEEPTLLLTNQMRRTPAALVQRYAQRMLIENGIEDALLSHGRAVVGRCHEGQLRRAIDADGQQLIPTVGTARRQRLRDGKAHGISSGTSSTPVPTSSLPSVRSLCSTRNVAHNPLLIAAGFADSDTRVPWLGRKTLRFQLG